MFFTKARPALKIYEPAYEEFIATSREHDANCEFAASVSHNIPMSVGRERARRLHAVSSDLYDFTKLGDFDAVIFLDNAARGIATAIDEAKKLDPDSKSAVQYLFMNPYFFLTKDYLQELEKDLGKDHRACSRIAARIIDSLNPKNHYADSKDIFGEQALQFNARNFDRKKQKDLWRYLRKAKLSKNSKILIVDSCTHYDSTLRAVKRGFERIGMKNLNFAVLVDHGLQEPMLDKYVCNKDPKESACMPVPSVARIISQKGTDIHSFPRPKGIFRRAMQKIEGVDSFELADRQLNSRIRQIMRDGP